MTLSSGGNYCKIARVQETLLQAASSDDTQLLIP